LIKNILNLNFIYTHGYAYAIVFNEIYFDDDLKFPKYKLLTLYIVLMHVIEYYLYVN
jgi:hypothetical protein